MPGPTTIADYRDIARKHGLEFTGSLIPAGTTMSSSAWRCPEGHTTTIAYDNLKQKFKGCTRCRGGKFTKTLEDYRQLGARISLDLIARQVPATVRDETLWRCLKHGTEHSKSYRVVEDLQQSPCGLCRKEMVQAAQESERIEFDYQLLPEDSYKYTELQQLCRDQGITIRTKRKAQLYVDLAARYARFLEQQGSADDERRPADPVSSGKDEVKEDIGPKLSSQVSVPPLPDLVENKPESAAEVKLAEETSSSNDEPETDIIVIRKDPKPRGELDLSSFQTTLYQPLLEITELLTVKEFVGRLELPMEMFRVDEYWDGFKHPAKFMVVDKAMLDWLGYEGSLKNQRVGALKNLRSNFEAGVDYLYEGCLEAALLIGLDRQPKRAKLLAVSYPCLLQWSMMIQTARGNEIRKQAVAQQLLFRLYMEYQTEFQSKKQLLMIEEQQERIELERNANKKLKRSLATYQKAHRYVKFSLDSAYYGFSYGRRCAEQCILHHLIKHGIAINNKQGSGPIDVRLKTHRTTFKWLIVEFIFTAPPVAIEALEVAMEAKFGKNLNPQSSEVFEKVSVNVLKTAAIALLEMICPGEWSEISRDKIVEYNEDVDYMIKEGIDPVEEDDSVEENGKHPQASMIQFNDDHSSINIDNSIHTHIHVDLERFESLLKALESFTIKQLDPLLTEFGVSKHGNRAKKIEKLRDFCAAKIKDYRQVYSRLDLTRPNG